MLQRIRTRNLSMLTRHCPHVKALWHQELNNVAKLIRSKYIQTQVFDSAFGSRQGGPLNANQNWVGRDDTTELFFRDWDHVQRCFSSNYVKTTIAPDGPFFADFETSVVLMAYEKTIPLQTSAAVKRAEAGEEGMDSGDSTVAMYFISTPDDRKDGEVLEQTITPRLVDAINACCQGQAWGLICNVGAVSDQFDLNSYFGGANMPQYALVYKIFLTGPESVPLVRKAQAQFEKHAVDQSIIDLHKSFILFSQEALVMDVEKEVRVRCVACSYKNLTDLITCSSAAIVSQLLETFLAHLILTK
jgi:hypothetical protein